MIDRELIVRRILDGLPQAQAVYLFGSSATGAMRGDSDIDIAVLLPPAIAREAGTLAGQPLHLGLESALSCDVDLINLREAPTVFQKEIVIEGDRMFCADEAAADEFEMLVLSFYQKLNAERAGILAEGMASGHFLQA